MKNKKLVNVLLVILPAATVALTALPDCVAMKFASPEEVYIEYCSGFSMLPPGYGNWGPMLAGISSIILCLLGIAFCVKPGKKVAKWMFGITVFALIMSLVSLIFGSMTIISFLISALLASEAALLYYIRS